MAEANNPGTVSPSNSTEYDTDRVFEEAEKMEPQMDDADASLQRFLQQQRSDLMFELRRIQHGERPVTGQNNREQIASFMAKYTQEPQGASAGKTNVPANVDNVEEHRPEAIVVEVQGVVEQHRVSSMLQSEGFRRHLENVIRGSIGSAVSRQQPAARARASNSPRPATPEVATAASTTASRNRASSQETVTSGTDNVDAAPSVVRPTARAGANPQPPINQFQQAPPQAPMAPSPGEDNELNRDGRLLDSISEMHREEMVYEISDLLHRRLVSSTLGSEFRTTMELHVQGHLQQQEADGEAVANYVRNIRQSQAHIPNDFRHLGIVPGPREDLSDNISITGISATAVPYAQTNLHMSREMQSLKSQMEEMKNMLRLSFDLQMDIQRAIRQEVAAAIAAATAQGATAAVPEVRSVPVNDTHCLICLDSHSDSVLYQCGHMCVCFTCGKNLMTRGNGKCPVCRAPIKDIIRAYKTNVE